MTDVNRHRSDGNVSDNDVHAGRPEHRRSAPALLPIRPIGPETRFIAWTVGLIALLIGLTMLLLPFLFENPTYDMVRPFLLPLGLLQTTSGTVALVWLVLPVERTRVPQISLLFGACGATFWALSSLYTRVWTPAGINFTVAVTLTLAVFGIESRLRHPFRGRLLSAAVGVGLAVTGFAVLLFPQTLSSPAYEGIRPHAVIWAVAMLLSAAAIWAWVRSSGKGFSRLLPIFAAAVLVAWCYAYGVRNVLPLAEIELPVLALALAVCPFLPERWLSPAPSRLVNRLVAVSMLSVGIALILLVVVLLSQTEAAYVQRAELDLAGTAMQVQNNSVAFVNEQVRFAGSMSRDPEIESFEPARQLAALQRGPQLDPAASLISIVNQDGITVLRSSGDQPGVDRRQQLPGAEQIFTTHQPNWTLQVSPTLGVPALAVRQPITDPTTGLYAGAVVVQVKLSTLTSMLRTVLADPSARIIIVDDQGRAVVDPNPGNVLNQVNLSAQPPLAAARAGHAGAVIYRDGGQRWLATSSVVNGLGWIVDVERPLQVVLAPANRARQQATAFLVVMLLLAAATAWLFARGFTRPVRELVGLARSLGEGAVVPDLPAARQDEVGELVHAFGDMRDRLLARTRERERAELAAARSKREVEALLTAADRLNSAVETDEVLRSLIAVVADLLVANRVDVATCEGEEIVRRYTWSDHLWQSRAILDAGDRSVAGWVTAHQRPYRGNAKPGWVSGADPIAPDNLLAVPVVGSEGSALAAFWVEGRRNNQPFSDADERLALGIAHHAAVALERAALVRELRQSEERFRHQALSDTLTDLPNRADFVDQLSRRLVIAKRDEQSVALLFLDLDGFKSINDSLGHAIGDEILVAIGMRLRASYDSRGAVARFGGDEFAVLLDQVDEPADAVRAADKLLAELRRPIKVRSREIVITASFGVAIGGAPQPDAGPDDLLREADIALYQAKAAGKAQAVLFSPSMSAQAFERWSLENDLRQAVARNELRLYYQPIFDLYSRELVATEALVRWQHPTRGLLEPEAFVRLAEESGLIVSIGRWVLEEACAQARRWQSGGGSASPLVMSVNLSVHQLQQTDLVQQVAAILSAEGLAPEALELELTESVVMRDPDTALPKLEELKQLGIGVAIDDFGTGYSSLSYLQRLAVKSLKIDRSFVGEMGRDPGSLGIVQVIINLAHARGLVVTAEGIESEAQLEQLRTLECDRGQGYYFSAPLPSSQMERLLEVTRV